MVSRPHHHARGPDRTRHSNRIGANIAFWFLLYRELKDPTGLGSPGTQSMLLLSAAYVFGCAFRSVLPRADVQRICLFDAWLSSVFVGRTVATVAPERIRGPFLRLRPAQTLDPDKIPLGHDKP